MCITSTITTVVDMIFIMFLSTLTKKDTDFMLKNRHLDSQQKHR